MMILKKSNSENNKKEGRKNLQRKNPQRKREGSNDQNHEATVRRAGKNQRKRIQRKR